MPLFISTRSIFCILINILFLSLPACATKENLLHSKYDNTKIRTYQKNTSNSNLPQLTLIKPTKGKQISSAFGMRSHPIKGRQLLHTGVDISGNRGDKIVAAADGIITFSGRRGSYGLMIDLDIGSGVILRYAHLDRLGVKKGARVTQGQCIGKLGRTGRATAPHLHFEVRVNNTPVDPMLFITPTHHWSIKQPQTNPCISIQKKM